MKRVTVFVGGIRSVLQSQENEEYIRHVASRADLLLRTVKHENPTLATDKAAVLALINAVDRMERQAMKKHEEYETSVQDRRRIERLEAALSDANRTIEETRARLDEYQARDQLLEAGMIPPGTPALLLSDEEFDEQVLNIIELNKDQLSFSQLIDEQDEV